MLFKMSEDKTESAQPTVVFATPQATNNGAMEAASTKKGRLTRKHLMIAGVALIITALIVTGVLVGIRIYMDAHLEELKYSLEYKGVSQNVTTDKNIVTYHVVKDGVEAWVVQDFDKGIQVTKMLADNKAACYVTVLNRSLASDASSLPTTSPSVNDDTPSDSVLFTVVPDEITDISYLGSKASAMCKNIPTYHAVPDCGTANNDDVRVSNTTDVGRRKRTPRLCATCNRYACTCACGCCGMICGRLASTTYHVRYYCTSTGCTWICTFYFYEVYYRYSLKPTCSYNGYSYNPY
jgi:hypothetical protein